MLEEKVQTMTSRFNRGIAITLTILAGVLVLGQTPAGAKQTLVVAVVAIWAIYFAFIALWQPKLQVTDAEVQVFNPFFTYRINFAAIVQLDTKFSLAIRTPKELISVWVAPAPGAIATLRLKPNARSRGARTGERVPVGQMLGTESGNAYALVNTRWRKLVEEGNLPLGEAERHPVIRHINRAAIYLGLIAAVITIIALAVLANWNLG